MAREGRVLLRADTGQEGARLRLRVEAPALVLTLPGAIVLEPDERILDRSGWAVLPAGTRIALRVTSATARVVVLELGPSVLTRALADYGPVGMRRAALTEVFAQPRTLPRTTWVDELAHRYVFERGVCRAHTSLAARFLEVELVKEAYFLTVERATERERAPATITHSPPVARAVAWIEAHLGRPIDTSRIARHAGASRRTLERLFREELGRAPAAFVRARRLDEARVLLRAGRLSVTEIAVRVGYGDASSFSTAYRRRFGRPPSDERGSA